MPLQQEPDMSQPETAPILAQIEKRDNHLWWLAICIIVLLTLTVTSMDSYPLIEKVGKKRINLSNINPVTIRLSLIMSSFIICAYFRECVRTLLRMNRSLVFDLEAQRSAMARKNVELSRLKQLSDVLMTRQDIASALDIALRMATEVIGADKSSIMLLDESGEYLKIVAAKGLSEDIVRDTRIRVGDGLAGLVALEGESIILDSDTLDDKLRPLAHRTDKVQSAVISPIKVEGCVRGVINVTNRRDGGKYTKEDLNTVATLAQQASMVIQKIELYHNLELQVVKLQEALDQLSQTQAELIQAEKLACIGQLAGGLAHEINNPLHVMLGRTDLLLSKLPKDAPDRRDLQILYEQGERVATIVRNLLSFARPGTRGDYRPVDVNRVIGQTVDLVENQMRANNIELIRNEAADLPDIYANAGELQQVFLNMVLNAYQAMKPSGGRIEITSRAVNGNVEVVFTDNGPGIAEDHVTHLFEPFFTTKPEGEGVGLGLSISYGIIQGHGGHIDVESEVGSGASFKIVLPSRELAMAA